ncbi:MAG: PaaI family thioesterase, partial [Chloroflexi bacterium]|nr:PaaI family thioesterase [Chloroflexota bacterium]
MDLDPLVNQSRTLVQKWLEALRGEPSPWADELERWLLAWHARVLQAAHSTGERQAHALRAAREAVGVVRGLLPLAPQGSALDPAETDRMLEDWLARAIAFETAAQPPAVASPGVVDGLTQQALQQLHQHSHGLQPNSAHCFVCGLRNPYGLKMRFLQIAPDRVRAYAVVPEVYQGYPGVVHGGILAAMMDEVTGRAASGTDPATARLFYT